MHIFVYSYSSCCQSDLKACQKSESTFSQPSYLFYKDRRSPSHPVWCDVRRVCHFVFACSCECIRMNVCVMKKELPGWSENQSRECCWCTPTDLFSTPGFSTKRQSGPLLAWCVSVWWERDLPGGLTYTFSFRQARPTWFGWGDAAKRRRKAV